MWRNQENRQPKMELYTLTLSPQIDDSDSTSEYSDDDVMGRGRSQPETKPILSVREYRECEDCLWCIGFITVPLNWTGHSYPLVHQQPVVYHCPAKPFLLNVTKGIKQCF